MARWRLPPSVMRWSTRSMKKSSSMPICVPSALVELSLSLILSLMSRVNTSSKTSVSYWASRVTFAMAMGSL